MDGEQRGANEMNDDNVLSRIPGELLAPYTQRASASAPRGPPISNASSFAYPDGVRAEVTYVKIKSKKGKTTRWFWTPDSARITE